MRDSFLMVLGFGGSLLLGACNQAKTEAAPAAPAPAPAPVAEAPAKPPVAPAAQPSKDSPSTIEDPSFTLRLVGAGPYKAGELGRVVLQLEPHGVYHVNQEYPVEVNVSGDDAMSLPKGKLEKSDAAEFVEKDARFEVPFTAKVAGEHRIMANVKFAVCTKENCVPDERNLSLALAVQ